MSNSPFPRIAGVVTSLPKKFCLKGEDNMTKKERLTYWKQVVDEQTLSGLSVSSFCLHHNLKASQFYRWRRKFKSQNAPGSSDGFIELIPSLKDSSSGIRIRLFHELCIEVERGFDPVTLRAVIHALYSGSEQTCSH
jgi:hypothetical protein